MVKIDQWCVVCVEGVSESDQVKYYTESTYARLVPLLTHFGLTIWGSKSFFSVTALLIFLLSLSVPTHQTIMPLLLSKWYSTRDCNLNYLEKYLIQTDTFQSSQIKNVDSCPTTYLGILLQCVRCFPTRRLLVL